VAAEGQQSAGDAWGDDILPERQTELEQHLQAWEREADHGERKGPFDRQETNLRLTGVDVLWLAARTVAGSAENRAVAAASDTLWHAQVDVAIAVGLDLSALSLEGADLFEANLSHAVLSGARLMGADLTATDLSDATLFRANLAAANLGAANLSGATLFGANLSGAVLLGVNLSGANLGETQLSGATLRTARMSVETDLREAHLSTTTRLVDIVWNAAPIGASGLGDAAGRGR
jgi:uncharacterized protein YjbI with pentapeptide repeats